MLNGVCPVTERVVESAKQAEIVEIGFAAVGPVVDVMDVTPGGISSTTWVLAVAVSGDDCASQRW